MDSPYTCRRQDRRRRVRNQQPTVNGIEAVRVVSQKPPVLEVRLFRDWPAQVRASAPPLTAQNLQIDGSRRPPQALETSGFVNDVNGGGLFRITLDCPGDRATTYTLRLVDAANPAMPPADFDPQFSHLSFTFDRREILDEDPQTNKCLPDAPPLAPPIDYLAKDYSSFRRLVLDRLSQTIPQWTERRVPDFGITLVEALAYVADHLSYYQDAVATEAYLGTARRRTSLRRHARLVDFRMHDGCNARTWVCLRVADPLPPSVPLKDMEFFTAPNPLTLTNQGLTVRTTDDQAVQDAGIVVFEPIRVGDKEERRFHVSHNEMNFYTWGDSDCCLPQGATAATLIAPDPPPKVGDVLLFEEVLGPISGQPADADARRRWFVRLTGVELASDSVPPTGLVQLVNITWDVRDALPFSLCISSGRLQGVSVARGNVVLADHGQTQEDFPLTAPQPSSPDAPTAKGNTRIRLASALEHAPDGTRLPLNLPQPLTWAAPYPDPSAVAALQARRLALQLAGDGFTPLVAPTGRVASLPKEGRAEIAAIEQQVDELVQRVIADALAGQPMTAAAATEINTLLAGVQTALTSSTQAQAAPQPDYLEDAFDFIGPAADALRNDARQALAVIWLTDTANNETWTAQCDLLSSGSDDPHFVVEVEEDGSVWLRFGDGVEGRAPQPGQAFLVHCRLGNGASGNIGAEALTTLLVGGSDPDWVLSVRNPLPGVNGVAPEPLDYVRTFAPAAFLSDLRRAVCGEDYATLALKDDRVHRAAARLRWLGTHYEVLVAVDVLAEAISPALDVDVQRQIIYGQIEAMLNRYRRMGHEVYVVGPSYVPLLLRLSICISPNVERGRVKVAVEAVLGSHLLPGGKSGFFYADNLTFGQTIQTSALMALVQAVPGVASVVVLEFRRLADACGGVPPELSFGPLEIPQLEADSQHSELGQLIVQLEGGR